MENTSIEKGNWTCPRVGHGQTGGRCTEEPIGSPFQTKGDEYSPGGVQFQREHVEFLPKFGLVPPSHLAEGFLAVLCPHGYSMGRLMLTVLMSV